MKKKIATEKLNVYINCKKKIIKLRDKLFNYAVMALNKKKIKIPLVALTTYIAYKCLLRLLISDVYYNEYSNFVNNGNHLTAHSFFLKDKNYMTKMMALKSINESNYELEYHLVEKYIKLSKNQFCKENNLDSFFNSFLLLSEEEDYLIWSLI